VVVTYDDRSDVPHDVAFLAGPDHCDPHPTLVAGTLVVE
jgi:hypothetical protein